jgi:hypothetical protein
MVCMYLITILVARPSRSKNSARLTRAGPAALIRGIPGIPGNGVITYRSGPALYMHGGQDDVSSKQAPSNYDSFVPVGARSEATSLRTSQHTQTDILHGERSEAQRISSPRRIDMGLGMHTATPTRMLTTRDQPSNVVQWLLNYIQAKGLYF